ncbi:CLUMA_CG004867, isoform A [Clunio marinus]|uniref:CLUMA_CG004867, isoform A n=1 Tax=Clunio marinus TaxID=568069 RepID=A0A1J1HSZ8_9DIPT|nr:CLUMA_CG004867, isoform A [Clunio marinus]
MITTRLKREELKMSAEAHQKNAPSSDVVRLIPHIVPPQAVSDRSVIDSVAGFINDVALTNTPQTDSKDHVLWVKFENLADISGTSHDDWDLEGNLPSPLLLCIGYRSGVQVWVIPANGEAVEAMSYKHESVKVLRILPTPFLSSNSELASDLLDQFIHKRPLMALYSDAPVPNPSTLHQSQQFHAVNFVSIKDGDIVKSIRFKNPVVDIIANRTSIAITFSERIAVFDARTLEDRLTVTTCYPCPGGLCPIALGDRWLGYAEKKIIPSKASAGGCFFDGVSSYTATVLNAAKTLSKGLRELGEHVAAGLTGNASTLSTSPVNSPNAVSSAVNTDGNQAGIVTIIDIKNPIKDVSPTSGTPVTVNGNDPIIAHFIAHTEAVTAMSFDPSGMLLLTADRRGHDFNIFRIQSHPSPHVVNRLSRFHRSAGLSADGRSSSPILISEHAVHSTAYTNPRLPPFPHPTVVLPLAQIRQPANLSSVSSLSMLSSPQTSQHQNVKSQGNNRQRHHSIEESYSKPLRVASLFAKPRSWLLDPPGLTHETTTNLHLRPVDSLFVIASHGALIQYNLDTKHSSAIPKEKVHDESPIELDVEAKAQWILGTRSNSFGDLSPPLPIDNWLIKDRVIDNNLNLDSSNIENVSGDEHDDRWLSQVEIMTHAGPHRRLWMGPQFMFKTYNTPNGNLLGQNDNESVENEASKTARSTPMNMPIQRNPTTATRPLVPVLIESSSYSSHEPSPLLLDSFHYESTDSDIIMGPESQLREDLADAMKDCATVPVGRDSGRLTNDATLEVNVSGDLRPLSSGSGTSSLSPSCNLQTVVMSIVNPQGTVTTVIKSPIEFVELYSGNNKILENCDETMFRPVVTVMSDPNQHQLFYEEPSQPLEMSSKLIVPAIDERVLEKNKRKSNESNEIKKVLDRQEVEDRRIKESEEKKTEEVVKKVDEQSTGTVNKKGKKNQKFNKKVNEKSKESQPKVKTFNVEPVKSSVVENVTVKITESHFEEEKILPLIVVEKEKQQEVGEEKTSTSLKQKKKLPLKEPSPVRKVIEEKQPTTYNELFNKNDFPSMSKQAKKNKIQNSPKLEEIVPSSEIKVAENLSKRENEDDERFEGIDDDHIEVIPLEKEVVFDETTEEESDVERIDELDKISIEIKEEIFIESDENSDADDELPLFKSLETFDENFEPLCLNEQRQSSNVDEDDEKNKNLKEMKEGEEKLQEIFKDKTFVMAMCSSLREMNESSDGNFGMMREEKERSMSSSMVRDPEDDKTFACAITTTEATTNEIDENESDSNFKELDLDPDEMTSADIKFKVPADVKKSSDEAEDISSLEMNSSETDDSSKRSISTTMSKFKSDDDEELRPLLQSSATSLTSPCLSSSVTVNSTASTTEAKEATTLPDSNQKASSLQASSSNNGNGNNKRSPTNSSILSAESSSKSKDSVDSAEPKTDLTASTANVYGKDTLINFENEELSSSSFSSSYSGDLLHFTNASEDLI